MVYNRYANIVDAKRSDSSLALSFGMFVCGGGRVRIFFFLEMREMRKGENLEIVSIAQWKPRTLCKQLMPSINLLSAHSIVQKQYGC